LFQNAVLGCGFGIFNTKGGVTKLWLGARVLALELFLAPLAFSLLL